MENRAEFPLGAFPDHIQDTIIHYEQTKNFDRNIQALATIVHIASLVEMGTRFYVNGFDQVPIIWGNIIQESGKSKSHLMRHCLSHLFQKNEELHQDKQIKHTYVTTNTTIEGLFKKHINNRKGITMFKDELTGFVKGINNYQSGGAKEEWMNAWNGGSQDLTRSENVFHVDDLKPNILGATQPEKVYQLFDSESLGDGFATRFLNTEPYKVGKIYKPKTRAKQDQLKILDYLVHEPIWNLPARSYESTPEGDEIWRKWCDQKTDEYYGYPQYEMAQSKMETYAIRISGILHLMGIKPEENLSPIIAPQTIENSIHICDFFMGQYERMLNNLSMHRFPDKLEQELKTKTPKFQKIYAELNGKHYGNSELCNLFDNTYGPDNIKKILSKNILFQKHKKGGQHPTYTKTLRNE